MTAHLIEKITAPETLAQAWRWLAKRRGDSHYNNDYWHLRHHRARIEPEMIAALQNGSYRFSPCRWVRGHIIWSAQDALVLKAIALVLTPHLAPNISPRCYHATGNGGAKGCVRAVSERVKYFRFVCRSDVNSYYASIDHQVLRQQLSKLIDDSVLLQLFENMLNRLDDVDGELLSATVGITKGNPLSPLLGAVYLSGMDEVLESYCQQHGLFYARYMDDWVILCKTRYQLRTVVKLMNQQLNLVKQTKHPFKTYIGKIKENGFDFLGYRLTPKDKTQAKTPLGLAWKTWANHLTKLQQLYEQDTSENRIADYVTRWLTWVRSGVTINLHKVIREGLSSELAKSIGDVAWLTELYGRVVEQWAERR